MNSGSSGVALAQKSPVLAGRLLSFLSSLSAFISFYQLLSAFISLSRKPENTILQEQPRNGLGPFSILHHGTSLNPGAVQLAKIPFWVRASGPERTLQIDHCAVGCSSQTIEATTITTTRTTFCGSSLPSFDLFALPAVAQINRHNAFGTRSQT
jgi:hypothetical protein